MARRGEGADRHDDQVPRRRQGAAASSTPSNDHEKLFARGKDQYDGAQPSGNSVAARNLVRLWTEDRRRALPRWPRRPSSSRRAQGGADEPDDPGQGAGTLPRRPGEAMRSDRAARSCCVCWPQRRPASRRRTLPSLFDSLAATTSTRARRPIRSSKGWAKRRSTPYARQPTRATTRKSRAGPGDCLRRSPPRGFVTKRKPCKASGSWSTSAIRCLARGARGRLSANRLHGQRVRVEGYRLPRLLWKPAAGSRWQRGPPRRSISTQAAAARCCSSTPCKATHSNSAWTSPRITTGRRGWPTIRTVGRCSSR